jgi:hypothetical protein
VGAHKGRPYDTLAFAGPIAPQHCRVSGVDIHGVPSTATAETEDIMAKQAATKAEGRNLTLNPGDESAPGTPGTGEAICRDCGGTGRIGASSCPKCGGSGKVIKAIGGA